MTEEKREIILRPCPFCDATQGGGFVRLISSDVSPFSDSPFPVICWKCGAQSGYHATKKEAAESPMGERQKVYGFSASAGILRDDGRNTEGEGGQ